MNVVRINKSGQSVQQLQSGQQGVTLIDGLIALVIFSVGLLALAALQTVSKQSNFEAMQRTNATMFAYDLVERMRMNSGALGDYVGDSILTDAHTECITCPNANAIASNDLFAWKATVLGAKERNSGDPTRPCAADNPCIGGLVNPTACLTRVGLTNEFKLAIAWRGQTKLVNQNTSTCGTATGIGPYDDAAHDDFAYRRILELNTFIGN